MLLATAAVPCKRDIDYMLDILIVPPENTYQGVVQAFCTPLKISKVLTLVVPFFILSYDTNYTLVFFI